MSSHIEPKAGLGAPSICCICGAHVDAPAECKPNTGNIEWSEALDLEKQRKGRIVDTGKTFLFVSETSRQLCFWSDHVSGVAQSKLNAAAKRARAR